MDCLEKTVRRDRSEKGELREVVIEEVLETQFHIIQNQMNEEQQKQMLFQMMYSQLMGEYTALASSYKAQNQENLELYQQLEGLLQQKITLLQEDVPTQATLPPPPPSDDPLLQDSPHKNPRSEALSQEFSLGRSRKESRIYNCTYQECARTYRSSVSMNLHIKLKHNGGTKKEREAMAKMIIEAQERGEPRPEVALNFPPGFLEEFRRSYQYTKKYNM